MLGHQFFYFHFNILRAAASIWIFEVRIEFRQGDITDIADFTFQFEDGRFGKSFIEDDFVTQDGDVTDGSIRFLDGQGHLGALRSANEGDYFIHQPAGDIDRFNFSLLFDFENLIVYLQFFLFPCRSAGDNGYDLGIIAVHLKTGTDTFKSTGHIDVKIFFLFGIEVVGVRIIDIGDGIDIHLEAV